MVKPYRQGDLDGLCELYAPLNAVKFIYPKIDDDIDEIFSSILKKDYSVDTILSGGEIDMVMTNLTRMHDFLLAKHKVKIKWIRPAMIEHKEIFNDWFDSMHFDFKNGALILGFEGYDSHWTVVNNADKNKLYLYDSWNYTNFIRKDVVWAPNKNDDLIIISPSDLVWVSLDKS